MCVRLPVCLSVCLCVCSFACLFVRLSVCVSVCLCVFVCLCVCPFVCVHHMFVHVCVEMSYKTNICVRKFTVIVRRFALQFLGTELGVDTVATARGVHNFMVHD